MNRKTGKIFLFAALVLAVALIVYSFASKQKGTGIQSLETYVVSEKTVKPYLTVSGNLYPLESYELQFKFQGKVTSVNVKPGDEVKKGQVLAQIESNEVSKSLKNAELNLKTAQTRYDQTKETYEFQIKQTEKKINDTINNLNSLNQQISSLEKQLEELQKNYIPPYPEPVQNQISELQSKIATLNNQKNSLLSTKTELEASLENLKAKKRSDLKIAYYQLEQQKLVYESEKENIENLKLYSPFDGIVLYVGIKEGQELSGGSQTIQSLSTGQMTSSLSSNTNSASSPKIIIAPLNYKILADVSIDQVDATKVKTGLFAEAVPDALPNVKLKGKVEIINYYPDSANTSGISYTVRIVFENNDEKVLPGMSALINIYLKEQTGLAVPVTAIRYLNGQPFVFKINNQQVKQIKVETGESDDKFTIVKSGLKKGDRIVRDVSKISNLGNRQTTSNFDQSSRRPPAAGPFRFR